MKKTIFLILVSIHLLSFAKLSFAEKIYLDITQPGIKKIHLALEGFDKIDKVFNTIKEDLEFTEYFQIYGPFPLKDENFQPHFWQSSNVDIVVQAKITNKIQTKFFTLSSNLPFFTKEYNFQNNEHTGHLIASDIYKALTGKESPFFNRIVFIKKFKETAGIFISNWNGKSIHDTGIRREIISRAVLKGNKILYSSLQGRFWRIELFDLSTKINKEIIKSKALLQLGDIVGDSQFIYLYNDGDLSEIKISDIAGRSKTVSSSRWVESSPRWYGSRIFFVSNRAGSPQIYYTQEGGSPQRVTYQGRYNTEPSVSPDGSKLAFSSLIGGFQIYVLDLATGTQTQITKAGNNEQPSFCPDGHFLTIMSDRKGKREINLISSNGLVQKSLTTGYLPYCTR